jgi:hypothetical protein
MSPIEFGSVQKSDRHIVQLRARWPAFRGRARSHVVMITPRSVTVQVVAGIKTFPLVS